MRQPRIFAPLWHPPEGGYAGGIYRAKRLLEQMRRFRFEVTDTDTSDLRRDLLNGSLVLIPAKRVYGAGIAFNAMRALNWAWTCAATFVIGLFRGRGCDAIYVSYSELIPLTLAAFALSRIHRLPLVLCNLNVQGTSFWILNRWLHNHCSLVITLSRGLHDELVAAGVRTPIAIGGVGVDDMAVPRAAEPKYDAIYVARHTTEKGALDAIHIWSRCCAKRATAKLAMVGPCSPAMAHQIQRLIAQYGLTNNIDVLGAVSENEKWTLYAASRICIFPSRVEGWGIVPIEAHLMQIPVVAYELPAYAETIAHSPAARLCTVGDYDSFADYVLQYMDDFTGGLQAREWALQFSWPGVVSREEALLDGVMGRP